MDFGETSSDTEIGRRSTATMDAFEGGANGTKSALKVAGEVFPNPQFCLGGSLLSSWRFAARSSRFLEKENDFVLGQRGWEDLFDCSSDPDQLWFGSDYKTICSRTRVDAIFIRTVRLRHPAATSLELRSHVPRKWGNSSSR
jgi:hypothetical protein